jgi:hypothetical protein
MGMLDFMLGEGSGFGAKPAPIAKVPVLPQTPAAMADVAAATRAARVAQYGESAVAAMEAAGSRFGGAVGAAPVTAAPAAPTGALYNAGKWIGKTVGRLGPAAGLGAMGFGMADRLSDGQKERVFEEKFRLYI